MGIFNKEFLTQFCPLKIGLHSLKHYICLRISYRSGNDFQT